MVKKKPETYNMCYRCWGPDSCCWPEALTASRISLVQAPWAASALSHGKAADGSWVRIRGPGPWLCSLCCQLHPWVPMAARRSPS